MASTIDSGARELRNSARSGRVGNDHMSMAVVDDVYVSKWEAWEPWEVTRV
jgi:hypothetical protein